MSDETSPPAPPEVLSWTDWPARRRPARAALAGSLLLLAVGTVAQVDPWLAVAGGAMLLAATAEGLLPARYQLDEAGVTVQRGPSRRHLPWDRVAAVHPHPDGLLLRARGARPWLARRHDLVLRNPPVGTTARCAACGAPVRSAAYGAEDRS